MAGKSEHAYFGARADVNGFSGKGWDVPYYHRQAQVFKRISVPGEYREDGEDWEVVFDGPESVWELDTVRDFDSRILLYASSEWSRIRVEALTDARKN